MGELDEAIRQHIALKRQHGVSDSELRELEQEAFGPAERPAAPSEVTPAEAHEVPELFREQPGEPSSEPRDQAAPPPADAPPIVDIPTEESAPPFEAEEPEPPAPEPEPAPGPEITPPPPAPEPSPPEPPPPAAEPGQETDPEAELGLGPDDGPSFFDQEPGEADEAEKPSGDTGEESLYDELDALLGDEDEGGGTAVEERQPEEQQPQEEQPEEEPENSAEEGDSLLEETPDFLQDAPEQDDLWFDQQPPKDFDFDD